MGQKAVSPSRQGYGAAAGSKDWLQAGGGGSLLPHFVAGLHAQGRGRDVHQHQQRRGHGRVRLPGGHGVRPGQAARHRAGRPQDQAV